MSTITVYSFQDAEGNDLTYETQDPREAEEFGRKNHALVEANEYEWADATTSWDFRPNVYKVEVYVGDEVLTSGEFDDQAEAELHATATFERPRIGDVLRYWNVWQYAGDFQASDDVTSVKVGQYARDGRRVSTVVEWERDA